MSIKVNLTTNIYWGKIEYISGDDIIILNLVNYFLKR